MESLPGDDVETASSLLSSHQMQAQRQDNGDPSVTSLDDSDIQIIVVPTFVETTSDFNKNLNTLRRELYAYAAQNRWPQAKLIYDEFNEIVRIPLTPRGDTALHVAVSLNSDTFVKGFINLQYVTPEDLEIPNVDENTAFCVAAITGNGDFSQIMIDKNEKLPLIPGHDGMLPVHLAALHGHQHIVKDLSSKDVLLKMDFKHIEQLFFMTIDSDMYDVAMKLVDEYSGKLVVARRDDKQTALHMLMRKPSESGDTHTIFYIYLRMLLINFNCTFLLNWGRRLTRSSPDMHGNNGEKIWGDQLKLVQKLWSHVQQLEHKKMVELISNPSVIFFEAVESRNFEIVKWLLYINRDLLTIKDPENGRNILHVAALCQNTKVIRFILEMETSKLIIREVDKDGNNVLHLAACCPKQKDTRNESPNIRMQMETVHFKELENTVPHELTIMRNKDGKTPIELLHANHEDISKEVMEFAKSVAKSGMLVAALVATIAFAAALTDSGDKSSLSFAFFFVANAFALFTSASAIVIFFIIFVQSKVTSESIGSLQEMLFVGPVLLVVSIMYMVLSFDAASCWIFEDYGMMPVLFLLGILPAIALTKAGRAIAGRAIAGRAISLKKQKYKKW